MMVSCDARIPLGYARRNVLAILLALYQMYISSYIIYATRFHNETTLYQFPASNDESHMS